ncbi:MAG: glycoside hydrolase family 31 protein [Ferruginibacter sp.]
MKTFFSLPCMLALVVISSQLCAQPVPVETLGNVQAVAQHGNNIIIKTQEAEARVWIYSPAVIRINISKKYTPEDTSFVVIRKEGVINYTETKAEIIVKTALVKLVIGKSPLRFNFYTANGKALSADDAMLGTSWQASRVTNYRKLYPDERFIGLGEKKGNLDRRGKSFVNWSADVGGDDPQYKSFPFNMGLHGGLVYGIFLDNTNKSYFDFGASGEKQTSSFGADAGDLNYYFFGAQTIAGIIKDYTWLTGRMEMPPLWSLGYQQCRWSYGSTKEMLEVARTFRRLQIPADVLYCDIDYMDHYKIFTWNNDNFPDPKAMIDSLKAMDFHLVTIVDPGIKVEKGYDKYDEGLAKKYFVSNTKGEPYLGKAWPGEVYFPDFLNSKVRKWWGNSFTVLTNPGVEGFWNDMNEPSTWGKNPQEDVRIGKYSVATVNNIVGMQMARSTYEGVRELMGNKRPFILTRAAYAGVQRYSAVWTGDNTSNDEHLLLGQSLVNALGLSGMAFAGVDIGGFFGNGSPNLMVRWNSLGVYTPMFRNHACTGTAYREPWRWGEENEKLIKADIEERYRLMPYIYSTFYQAHQTGLPVSRSLAISYGQDENVYREVYQNEFLFGDNILVAPVISSVTTADVYLPKGNWYKKTTDSLYAGGKNYQVAAPLNDLPIFIKAGAIIPKQHVVQSTSDKGDGILELHIWNGKEGSSFNYYEDDGSSYNYQQGQYYNRVIHFNPLKRNIVLEEASGKSASKYSSLKLVLHGFGDSRSIMVNGKTISGKNNSGDVLFENKRAVLSITY